MGNLTRRGWTAVDYAAFKARCAEPHTVRWQANAYRSLAGGAENLLMPDIPITGGQLTLDSSDPVRRKLTLQVGGGDAFAATTAEDPLVPFGQFLKLWCRIDKSDGTWFPNILMGIFPIKTYTYERPSQIATVECTDLSGRVEEFLLLGKRGFKGKRVAATIEDLVIEALPDRIVDLAAVDAAKTREISNYTADAGTGRWTVCTEIADRKAFETFFDYDGTVVVRNMITDSYDDVIMGVGPDIGTVTNPVATIRDGEGGTLVGVTATVSREGGCNYVRLNLTGTTTKRLKNQNKKKPGIETKKVTWADHVDAQAATAPVEWGGPFGYLPIVEPRDLQKVEAGEKADKLEEAQRILRRRRGVVRYLDFDVAGGYWVEPDDRVRIQYAGRAEDHFVQSVAFDLSGKSATRMRTRAIAVRDPG